MKLTTLTEEQKKRLTEIKDEYINLFLSYQPINLPKATEVINFIYELCKKEPPKIYVVLSPKEAQLLANKLKGTENKFYVFGSFLTIYWASFYAYYDAFVELGIITKERFPKYFKLRESMYTGIFTTIEFDKAIIIVEKPLEIKRENGRMHCVTGPAIRWSDGYCQYYIHGRNMPKWIFEKTITKEMFIKEENEDIKAGIYEVMEGKKEGTMLDFLGAKEIDRRLFVHANGETEEMILYKTVESFKEESDLNGKTNVPLAWIKMSCPSTGTNYLIPSDSSFNDCISAAKYHRPNEVPTKLDYSWKSRN